MNSFFVKAKSLNLFDDFKVIGQKIFIVNFGWDYLEALEWQKMAVNLVIENPEIEFYFLCSHKPCFTQGRGIRQIDSEKNLLYSQSDLSIPLYQINRGGGLTYHGPNQLIIYPIRHLTTKKLTLKGHIDELMNHVKKAVFDELEVQLICKSNPLGLWKENNKIASVGVGLKKWVTFHGLAINLLDDKIMDESIRGLKPCGLNSNIYKSLESLSSGQTVDRLSITKRLIRAFS